MTRGQKCGLVVAALIAGAVQTVRHGVGWWQEERALRTLAAAPRRSAATRPVSDAGLEVRVAAVARRQGIARLARVSTAVSAGDPETVIEWQSKGERVAACLDDFQRSAQAGDVQRLSISADDSGGLQVRATLSPVSVSVHASTPPAPGGRDVFHPLWRETAVAAVPAADTRREERRRREEDAKRAEEMRAAEAQRVLDEKRRRLQTAFALTGIANNGRDTLAFVDATGGNRQTLIVKKGDAIEGASVEAIDEVRGELRLNYEGQFAVVLRLGAARPENF